LESVFPDPDEMEKIHLVFWGDFKKIG